MLTKRKLYVLIACEESQAECIAFRALGHYAYSCDLQRCSKFGCPDWHIVGDVTPLLHGRTVFRVQSGLQKKVPKWDLVIAHPPCTYLSRVSAVHLAESMARDGKRVQLMEQGRAFFYECLNAEAPFVAVENPVPLEIAGLPMPDGYANPSWFGEHFTKKTCYWLKNLPPLMPEVLNPDAKSLVAARRGKYRSRTSPLMATAIARQWSDYVLKH